MNKLISVIIPIYNEEKVISSCLQSLRNQTYKPIETIIIDDGSTDETLKIISTLDSPASLAKRGEQLSTLKMLHQNHLGPGPARNLGAKFAKGEILVFVDADMTFDKNFIKDLTKPILVAKTIGTFSKNEMVANKNNIWSICWNMNRNVPPDRMLPNNYANKAPVFRAILKTEFEKVGGFDATGEYTDDWSLSKKLGKKSTVVKDALYYHSNPENLHEVFKQARWIGKNEFIAGNFIRRIRSLIFYSMPVTIIIALYKSAKNLKAEFIIFKIIYDLAIFISVFKSFFKENKSK